MARVLIATDGSDFSIAAAQRALPLLGEGHDVTVLSVAALPLGGTLVTGPEGAGFAPAPAPETTASLEEGAEQEAQANVDRTVAALGIAATKRVERGDPRLVICEVAEHDRFDLIVVGSHGTGLLKRVLLGSVSHHVLHHAHAPVLMMRLDDTLA